jgi:hypothetical protein
MADGVSSTELRAMPPPLQNIVMEAWFRANFRPAQAYFSADIFSPELELIKEFSGAVPKDVCTALGKRLAEEASSWAAEEYIEQNLGNNWHKITILRLEEAEEALTKIETKHGGIGHNNPPDAPLTAEERREATEVLQELRKDVLTEKPPPARLQQAIAVLVKAGAAIGGWIWKRVELATDEAIKKAIGTSTIITVADAMDAWQKITALVEALGRWISVISG